MNAKFSVLTAVLVLVASASAQLPEEPPLVYLWHVVTGEQVPTYASQVVRFKVDEFPDGYAAGLAFAAQAWHQIEMTHTTKPTAVALILQNFGHWVWQAPAIPSPNMVSFMDPLDPISPPPQWLPPPDIFEPEMPYMQPWLTVGRAKVGAWMAAFIDGYNATQGGRPGPPPTLFLYDTEVVLMSCCSRNWTRVLAGVAGDARWYSTPVPGNDGKTMEQLYQDAIDAGLFPNIHPITAPGALNPQLPPDSDPNRKYTIWYLERTERALDAILQETAYGNGPTPTLIKAAWPNCKVCNYNHINADGKTDTFGWYWGRASDHPPAQPPVFDKVRECTRGQTVVFGTGAQYRWNDFIYDPGGLNQRRSPWDTRMGVASGDLSAPETYPGVPAHHEGRFQVYLPPWANAATQSSAGLERARRTIESVLNTPGGAPSKMVPWVAAPTTFGYAAAETEDDTRRKLAMLRAKEASHVVLWWNHTLETPEWQILIKTLNDVYDPQLQGYGIVLGIDQPVQPDRLRYTLRIPSDPAQEVLELGAVPFGADWQVAVDITFNNLLVNYSEIASYDLNLECAVKPDSGDVTDVRGLIDAFRPTPPRGWVPMDGVNDFCWTPPNPPTSCPGNAGFGFFAPPNPASMGADAGWYDSRRTFRLTQFVDSSTGRMTVRITLRRPVTSPHFVARFDLAQLVRIQGADCTGCDGAAMGADIDHSQSVNAMDLTEFTAAWIAGKRVADADRNGVVDIQDLNLYAALYNSSPP